ncbi:MAG: hypothetical protein R6U04_12725 [Bacteroidales bacterium]
MIRIMKKGVFFLIIILSAVSVYSQEKTELDTMYLLGQEKILVDIKGVRYTSVAYKEPGDDEMQYIKTKNLHKIIFASGRKEHFNDPLVMDVESIDWRNVILTEDESDVKNLHEVGEVHGNSGTNTRTPKSAERNAKIRIKRRAANMGAEFVLVTDTEASGGFGEVPTYEIEGIAYSYTEPTEEQKEEQKKQQEDK